MVLIYQIIMEIKSRTWVRILSTILEADQRSKNLPEDTTKVPVELWVKGYLLNDANMGDNVKVETLTGRVVEGKLIEVNPVYELNYGKFVPELLEVGEKVVKELSEAKND